jgi:hypothetical protein
MRRWCRRIPGDEEMVLQRLPPGGVSPAIIREASMRGTRCLHCKESFRPKRADQLYCRSLCRQAAYDMRVKASDKALAAATQAERKKGALRVLDQLDAHNTIATLLNARARSSGIDLKFAPSLRGVMAAEEQPGEFDKARALLAEFPYLERKEVDQNWRDGWLSVAARKDEAYNIAELENPGASFIAQQAQGDFADAVSRGANVIELTSNPDFIAARNRVASARNDDEIFRGGLRCPSCGATRHDGFGNWECCFGPIPEAHIPDAPRGLPVSPGLFRYVPTYG